LTLPNTKPVASKFPLKAFVLVSFRRSVHVTYITLQNISDTDRGKMMEIGTPLGLGFASGINAYLPLLSFAVSVRWLHLYKVNPTFAFITSNWCIIALVILTIVDFVADKIPIIDHTWDATHTFIRPLTGALVAAASSNHVTLPISTASISSHLLSTFSTATTVSSDIHIVGVGLLVIALLGGILAAMSHATKATTRLVSTFTTAGLLNVFLSFGEDILVCIAILLSLFVPAVMLILIVLFFLFFGPLIIRARNRWRN